MDKNKKPEVWQRHRIEEGPDLHILQVRFDWLRHPKNQKEMKRLVLEANDRVNVVATTHKNEIVVVRLYRFGVEKITAEILGGMVDHEEDKQKDPDDDTSALERQIDQMVYTIYDLTPEEIAIVEGEEQ